MTESEVRKLLRQMKELDSQTAFRDFYNMTYDRLFRIAYYYVKQEEWSQEIVLDVFMKLWKQRSNLLDVRNIEDYCFILVKNAGFKIRRHIFCIRTTAFCEFFRILIPILCRSLKNRAIHRKNRSSVKSCSLFT